MKSPPDIRHGPSRSRFTGARIRRLLAGLIMAFVGLAVCVSAWICPRMPRFLESWPQPDSGFIHWQPLATGIEYSRAAFTRPRIMKCHALRIDLTRPELRLKVAHDPAAAAERLIARRTTSLLRANHLAVAINATPFTPEPLLPGPNVQPLGWIVDAGRTLAPPAPNFDALLIDTDGLPRFQRGQRLEAGVSEALGGFVVILADGKNRGETGIVDAVTAVGLSADRRSMYWLVVDGRQPGYSEGALGAEAGELMLQLGARDAMTFDGGGSTTLAARGGWAGARVLNRPRSPVVSGLQRPIAVALGIQVRER